MSKDLIPKNGVILPAELSKAGGWAGLSNSRGSQGSNVVATARFRLTSLPLLVAAVGLISLVFLHFILLGILFFGLGMVWLILGRAWGALKAKVARGDARVDGGLANNENSGEFARKQLKRSFMKLQAMDGCEVIAEQGLEHFVQAEQRFHSFDRVLRMKLQPTELTFSRYHGAAEQVFLSIMDRLSEVSELLASIESIRPSEVKEKLQTAQVSQVSGGSEGASEEGSLKALKERLAIVTQQQDKAKNLLKANEEGLTELDRANAALTEMKTKLGMASMDFDEALKQLEELAKRAKKYSS